MLRDNVMIKAQHEDPYEGLIKRYFSTEFPGISVKDLESQLEILTKLLVGTKEVRYGAQPTPESLVEIRKVIMKSLESTLPIPILIPWGGRKAIPGQGIDAAELFALKQIESLQNSVKQYFPAGLQVRIRLEDSGALYLFDRDDSLERDVKLYTESFQTLSDVLGLRFIDPIAESSFQSFEHYKHFSDQIATPMYHYLVETTANGLDSIAGQIRLGELKDMGWQGKIPLEQRDWYLGRYTHLYPHSTPEDRMMMLAKYFAGSLARYKLGMTGDDPLWGGQYLKLTFVPPIPGVPVSLKSKDLYYRTLPVSFARTHIAPWRGKGYLLIGDDDSITPKLVNWTDAQKMSFIEMCMELSEGNKMIKIQTDYSLTD